jgi:hypothetical protein
MVLALGEDAAGLPPALADKPGRPGATLAYVCRGSTCSAPLDSLSSLVGELKAADGAEA